MIIGEQVLDSVRGRGVDAEVFLLHNRELSIEVIDGQVDTLKEAEEIGLGLRVIKDGRLGFAFTSDLSRAALQDIVEDAVRITAYTSADPYQVLPSGPIKYPDMEIYDPAIVSTSLEEKIELARQVERTARQSDNRISVIERAGYEDNEFHALVLNSRGIKAYGNGNYCGAYIFVVAEEAGDAQTGFSMSVKQRLADLDPDFIGREAAAHAVRSLQARSAPSGRIPCVMEPYVVTRFLGILAQMADAEAVQKGKSLFAGRKGQQIASPAFSLVDDGIWTGGIGSFPFDSEGVPCQRTELIRAGELCGYLYDTYTAGRDGTVSTGNAQRGSFRSLPSVGTTNLMVQPGEKSPQDMIQDLQRGFLITEVMGMHTANPISGEFSVGAAGILIENGRLTTSVRGVTIAGNMLQMLEQVEMAGNDLRFFGGKGAPSLLIGQLSLSGE